MRIIAICDNRLTLNTLEIAIKRTVQFNAELRTFMLPSEALQYARDHPVDVAFVDMDMKSRSCTDCFWQRNSQNFIQR